MDDNKSNLNKDKESQEYDTIIERSESSSKSITEKKKAKLENAITTMLDQVMEDHDETTNNSNNVMNCLQFNDDESNEDDIYDFKMGRNFFQPPNINRSNKRLKTVINYPVNIQGMPFMNINQFNFNNRSNMYTMRSPSFGNINLNENRAYSNVNSFNQFVNSFNQFNDKSSNGSLNNVKIEPNFNNKIKNNANFLRNANPYSKTVIHHFPLGMFNAGFGFINNFQNTKINNMNNNNNYSENKNINTKNNNNNNSINEQPEQNYKRSDSRRKTYPNFNNNNEKPQKNANNNILIIPSYNGNFYQNQNNYNQINYNTEYLIFQLKFNLEKTGKIDHYIYSLVKGAFLNIIKNQKGSKIFQKYLKTTHCDILHQIFIELKPNLEEIITDFYANYFCKRFFTFLNQKDRIDFLYVIEKSLVKLSSDGIGTYPIQTIIEHVGSKNEKNIIINALKDSIKELSFDAFGTHVLEKLLACFEEEYVTFIYNYIVDNFLELANNSNGICIVKKLLSFTHKKNLHDKLKIIVKENALQLISHPFGNFVIQVVVECWNDYNDILYLFDKKYYSLSLEKYASNVVERCIEKDENILNNYIEEIININKICEVMKSNYGNYVIQKAIKLAKGEYKKKLVYNAAKDINKLKEPKLIKKWKSILSPNIKELSNEQLKYLEEQNFF